MNAIKKLIALFIAVPLGCAAAAQADGEHWTYSGHGGPSEWGALSPEFAACKLGKNQSPIDIRGANAADLPAIKFDYKPSPLKVIDNGHTIQVSYAPGSFIEVDGTQYELVQFHFTSPAKRRSAENRMRWSCTSCTRALRASSRLSLC